MKKNKINTKATGEDFYIQHGNDLVNKKNAKKTDLKKEDLNEIYG